MAQTASVRLVLNNLATTEQIEQMEERVMSALSDAIAKLQETVNNLQTAQNPQQVADLQAAVEAERAKYEALVASEEAEDVAQNQELADAKAATDALLAEMNSAATDLGGITAQLAAVGTAVDQAPDDQPVGEVPVEDVPVQGGADGPLPPTDADGGTSSSGQVIDKSDPAGDAPNEFGQSPELNAGPDPAGTNTTTEGGATPGEGTTPAPSSGETTDVGVSPDGGAPAEAGPAAGPVTGPTDSLGNPIDGPNI